MTFTEAVTHRTKQLLKQNCMSQYRLIKDSCLDKTTIQTIFKSKTHDIRLSTVFAIAEVFHLSLSEFFDSPYFDHDNIEI